MRYNHIYSHFSIRINDMHREAEQNRIINCRSCGAEFDSSLPNCPYCGRMNLPAAESEYMAKLENIRGNLEDLGEMADRKAIAHSRVLGRKLLIAIAVVFVIAAAALIVRAVQGRDEAGKGREEFLWQREAFLQFDKLYDSGDWAGLADAYRAARDDGHSVYQYSHSRFCDYLLQIELAKSSLQEYDERYDDPVFLFSNEIELYELDYIKNISNEERVLLEEMRAPLISDFEQRFNLSNDELSYFLIILSKDGFISIKECERFLNERGMEG